MSDLYSSHHTNSVSQQFDKQFGDFGPDVHVKDYYRVDGTHVQEHYRSHPDGNPLNNWSFPGHVNPHTGEVATGDTLHYLTHYQIEPASNLNTIMQHDDPLSQVHNFVMSPMNLI